MIDFPTSSGVSGVSKKINGRASGPVLTSGFLVILTHSAAGRSHSTSKSDCASPTVVEWRTAGKNYEIVRLSSLVSSDKSTESFMLFFSNQNAKKARHSAPAYKEIPFIRESNLSLTFFFVNLTAVKACARLQRNPALAIGHSNSTLMRHFHSYPYLELHRTIMFHHETIFFLPLNHSFLKRFIIIRI